MASKRLWTLVIALSLLVAFTLQAGTIQAQASHIVAILVVDDFTGADLSTVQAPNTDQPCAVNLEGQAFVLRGASAGPTIDKPHGELVYGQLQEMVTQLQADAYITLVKVDTQGLTMQALADAIQQAMTNAPAEVYVVNMSFVIMPCQNVKGMGNFEKQLKDARKNKDDKKYKDTFQQAVAYYDQTVHPGNSKKFQDKNYKDPLQTFFITNAQTVVPVAAAGNFGLDYPFFPAAWAQVISVSGSTGEGFVPPGSWDKKSDLPLLGAQNEDKNKKGTRISNYGAIMLPGEYTTTDYGTLLGTSFAAPRLSMEMALYLSNVGTAYCRNKKDNTPALAYGDWKNMTAQEAIAKYCPDMQLYLPQ